MTSRVHLMVLASIAAAVAAAAGLGAWGASPIARSRAAGADQPDQPAGTAVLFDRDIRPIFARRCANCHVGEKVKSGFSLASRADAMRGGDSGEPAIVPGRGAESPLYKVIAGFDPEREMPPKGGLLTKPQIERIRRWIDEGAVWEGTLSSPAAGGGGPADGAGPGKKTWHWSYQPVRRVEAPPVHQRAWVRGPIDTLVLSRLEAAGLAPSPEASRATLLRRVSLDLTGLPPTPEAVDAFEADTSADAYEQVVDRLLASPQYGERWARVWLDLARYADTHGYEKDSRRVMWPYRDWVIDALNRDMPFDRFTVEQLAGDLLPGAGLTQRIATGFHRNTQINEEGGTDPEEFRIEAVLDRVNTTASVWLGTTLSCCQCHDHKYDPFPQKEYFQFLAFFNQDEEDARVVNATATEKQAAGPMVAVPNWLDLEEYLRLAGRHDELWAEVRGAFPGVVAREPAARGRLIPAAAALQTCDARLQTLTVARTMVMGTAASPRQSHVFVRGSFLSPGEPVDPAVPSVLEGVVGPARSPDRLGLAEWIVDPANPLTPRVQVNRLWSVLFGRGLVETEDDFGVQADEPTNPELLDWLASEFVAQGWSQKQLLRTIVLSATYRQSSRVTPGALEHDPFNRLFTRGPRHRVEAEMIRDIALSASGLLSRKMYGPSVFPPQPPGIWTQIYSGDQWKESAGEDRFRRGVYTFARRTSPYPAFSGFDAPSREVACTRRSRTNTPLQALTTLNDPQYVEAAGALAVRMMREGGPTAGGRATRGMRLAISRVPTGAEVDRLVALHESQVSVYRADAAAAAALCDQIPGGAPPATELDRAELAAWMVVANTILNLDETITKE